MTWTYKQASGDLLKDRQFESVGYSGHPPDGVNNPDMEAIANVGPIPVGQWEIVEWFDTYEDKGPVVAQLSPVGFNPHGRSGFLIHGDNSAMNHTASDGCIILDRIIREAMRSSDDTNLLVVRE